MSREIKFRAWNPEKKMFGYVNLPPRSVSVPTADVFMRSSYSADHISFQHIEDWQQFTGLHDKNGKEIYEGDIVHAHLNDATYVVAHGEFEDCSSESDGDASLQYGWHLQRQKSYPGDSESLRGAETTLQVMGNIHENPDLLK